MKPRHFLDIDALPRQTLRAILDDAHAMKALGRSHLPDKVNVRQGAVLAMIFEQPSTRTRASFEVAMHELGGTSIMLSPADMQIGRGETIADTARVLSRYVDVIILRTGSHGKLLELAAHATVPVINGLTNLSHPCQVMADVMTFEEKKGSIEGATVAWLGDANNVAASWVHGAARFGYALKLGCPEKFKPAPEGARHQARIAFCTCSRFSASVHTTDCGPSITSAVTSSPRWAGRQCMKMASGLAHAITARSTWNGFRRLLRFFLSSPSPMDTQTSVTTQSAPRAAAWGSCPTLTEAPSLFAQASSSGAGLNFSGQPSLSA